MKSIVVIVLLSGCDGCAASDYFTEHGNVYECQTPELVVELCTDKSLDEFQKITGWDCWSTTRLWPKLTGCIYSCEPHSGCNATSGCYCPDN